MSAVPLICRLAPPLKWPVAIIGTCSALAIAADLSGFNSLSGFIPLIAFAVVVLTLTLFLCMTFDMRALRAVSALNAERRKYGAFAFFRVGNPVLMIVQIGLMPASVLSFALRHGPATALGFAASGLVTIVQIGHVIRDFPSDRFFSRFDW